MKKFMIACFLLFVAAVWIGNAGAREIEPILSTAQLEGMLADPKLVVLDVRKVEKYRSGHIPGSVNVTFGSWQAGRNGLIYQLPQQDELADMIGSAGIRTDSKVVIVCSTVSPQEQVHSCRVGCILQYAGVRNISILDGGFTKWRTEKRAVEKKIVKRKPVAFVPTVQPDLFADKDYVCRRIGRALLVDVREEYLFKGRKKQPNVERVGRIPGSVNLPTPDAFNPDGTFKGKAVLESLVAKAVGPDKKREIITYCDTGKCCPTWAFLMREALGYQNVRIYKGSLQEWARDPCLPMEGNGVPGEKK